MSAEEISDRVQEFWNLIDKGFEGPRFKGVYHADGPMEAPRLNSSIYTRGVPESTFAPELPCEKDKVWGIQIMPDGVYFRAELALHKDDNSKFLAAMFEGTGQLDSFVAYLLTNDLEYVRTHPAIQWERALTPQK